MSTALTSTAQEDLEPDEGPPLDGVCGACETPIAWHTPSELDACAEHVSDRPAVLPPER